MELEHQLLKVFPPPAIIPPRPKPTRPAQETQLLSRSHSMQHRSPAWRTTFFNPLSRIQPSLQNERACEQALPFDNALVRLPRTTGCWLLSGRCVLKECHGISALNFHFSKFTFLNRMPADSKTRAPISPRYQVSYFRFLQ